MNLQAADTEGMTPNHDVGGHRVPPPIAAGATRAPDMNSAVNPAQAPIIYPAPMFHVLTPGARGVGDSIKMVGPRLGNSHG